MLLKPLTNLPENAELQMLTVSYRGGESSPPHRHNAHTFVYVLEGSVIMQVSGGDSITLKAGDTFYELPEDVHIRSQNASESDAATFLVFMLKSAGAPTTIPLPGP